MSCVLLHDKNSAATIGLVSHKTNITDGELLRYKCVSYLADGMGSQTNIHIVLCHTAVMTGTR